MQRVGVKEFRVGVSQGWDITIILGKASYFDYYFFSYYLKEYVKRILVLPGFLDLGYLFSHCTLKFYLNGLSMFVFFYDGLFGEYRRLILRKKYRHKFKGGYKNRFRLGYKFRFKFRWQFGGRLRKRFTSILLKRGLRQEVRRRMKRLVLDLDEKFGVKGDGL